MDTSPLRDNKSNSLKDFSNNENQNNSRKSSGQMTPEKFYVKTSKDLEEIKKLLKGDSSQANARSSRGGNSDYRDAGKSPRDEAYENRRSGLGTQKKNFTDSFLDEFEKQMFEAVGGPQFKKELQGIFGQFADDLGVELKDLSGAWGKDLARIGVEKYLKLPMMNKAQDYAKRKMSQATKDIQEYYDRITRPVSEAADDIPEIDTRSYGEVAREKFDRFKDAAGNIKDSVVDKVKEAPGKAVDSVKDKISKGQQFVSDFKEAKAQTGSVRGAINTLKAAKAGSAGGEAAGVISQFKALSKGAGSLTKAFGAMGGPAAFATAGMEAFGAVVEGLSGTMQALGEAANRSETARKQREQNAKERMVADVEAMVKAPFDILEEAAKKAYDVWDNTLHQITQTQGYSKAEFQSLFGEYSQRLRDEGLQAVISSTSIVENLEKVLSSGLTGDAAKEFAYLATKLNQSVPTQDFFSYSESYASLIANQIRLGKSQSSAIEYANEQLENFASNLIYADRQIAGGLSSGLQNGSDLFTKAVQIATAANSNNIQGISGVISSVSAITGSIAPDMASGIVDAIYNAALGGNDSSIVALRSLAGGNASNTEFLKNFVNNPQGVFTELFSNLANMQNMSPSNYMEVAEGLASVFGLDKAAFQRVDFNYLAEAVSEMNVNNAALDENVKLLASGQTTLTQEQLRIKQINEYMVNEGLAYVLDNEVARSIQENMWAEQRKNELMENEFAVNLKGEAVNLLREIPEILFNVLNALTFGLAGMARGAYDIKQTIEQAEQQDKDLKEIVKAGLVGKGQQKDFDNLFTYGSDLKLATSYLEQIKNTSAKTSESTYKWEVVGKSMAKSLGTIATGSTYAASYTSQSSEEIALAKLESSFDKMKSTMSDFVTTSKQEDKDRELENQTRILRKAVSRNEINQLAKQYQEEYGMLADIAKVRAEDILNQRADEAAAKAAKAAVEEMDRQGKFGETGYNSWAATASKYGITNLQDTMADLGYNEDDFKNWFNSQETQAAAQKEADRNAMEEEFWSSTKTALETLNINVHDVFDKSDMMGIFYPKVKEELEFINYNENGLTEQFKLYRDEFTNYYNKWYDFNYNHAGYNNALLGTDWQGPNGSPTLLSRLDATIQATQKTSEDRINALTDLLTNVNNIADLMDPTVQQNVLLSEILKVLQVIMQQNNTQGKLALPDAIAALATGYTEA